ncbi:EscU/YscU/HrcU family type III secretion system export apparatus switch protein [Curtobacterium sp. MCSS17_016]|uniref:EscU/YscU/HrcU family type III secretion system export apparatus switch protein n=1 Tax=Curtobacterium sp. MCSS17_016 TaxID=2175644 RepID=UPI000DA94556|nr:EscU/YscU/HrcU family type III secretion system export apparatus switch protein [Curtobacterium sp. MCSS17_016]WIE80895.1 EscU/YscU/HrcU family type III secretion system export apparatus switch protein [Curtobacterium sp. MCSS17_016]
MADSGERTEQATEKRLKDARKKGSISKSRDLPAWVGMAAAAVMLPMTVLRAKSAALHQVLGLGDIIRSPSSSHAVSYMNEAFGSLAATLWPMFAAVTVAVVAGYVMQGAVHPKSLAPKFAQLNIFKGVVHMFSAKTLWEATKTLLKSAVVGLALWAVINGLLPIVASLGGMPVSSILSTAEDGVWQLVRLTIAAGLIFGGIDVFVVMRRNRKHTRMTKQEVKDENKSTDGDPMVRAHRRSHQQSMSRNRMIQAIADADVVVVNPTHVAVALRYEPGKSAPRVVAKGADNIAARIREEARAKGVPLVQDVTLARTLHKRCRLNEEIPLEFFPHVARILAFVGALKRRGASLNDVHQVPPQ